MPVKVSIIILNWNGLADTIECLESLKKSGSRDYEVLLVDNGSRGDDADVLERKYLDSVRVIRNEKNLGFSEGNNVAIRKAVEEKSEYVFLLNNDTIVEKGFLSELLDCAGRHPDAGSFQPKMVWSVDPRLIDAAGLEYSRNGLGFNRGGYEPKEGYDREEEILGCCAGAALYRTKALEEIALGDEFFDSDFFCNYEDFDLALRLQWAGWGSWYCPKSVVYHKRGASGGFQSSFSNYYRRRNQVWVYFKDMHGGLFWKNLPYFILAEFLQTLSSLARGQTETLKAKLDAYSGLGRMLAKKRRMKKKVRENAIGKWLVMRWRIKVPTIKKR